MLYDTWQSYFYPETYNAATGQGTLRNLYGERDAAALSLLELGMSRSFRWTVQEPPSAKDLPYPATTRPTPNTTPTPSIVKSRLSTQD